MMHKISFSFLLLFISLISIAQNNDFTISQTDLNRATTFYNNGIALNLDGKYEEAIKAYSNAIELNPYNLDFFKNRALVKKEIEKYSEALQDLNEAIKLDSTISELYYLKGNIFQVSEEAQKAVEMYTLAIYYYNRGDHSHSPIPYFFNRANVYLNQQQFRKALLDYNITLRLHPKHYPSYCNRGIAKYQLKNLKGAIADWKIAADGGIQQAEVYLKKYQKKDSL